jgi:integrating conjugative element protein (TIGR03756 family)
MRAHRAVLAVRRALAAQAAVACLTVTASLSMTGPATAQIDSTNTSAIMSATISALPSCLAYRVTGVCFWLRCTIFGCSVKTSIRVSHYVPDVVVSTFNAPEQHPWADVGKPIAGVMTGLGSSLMGSLLDASADTAREDKEVLTFKSADAIGNPIGALMGGNTNFEYPDTQELMKFASQELPRIMQMWASVPRDMANGVLEGARATAMNPSSMLGELGNLPGQVSGMFSSMQSLGSSSASTLPDGADAGAGGGGGDAGGGSAQSTDFSRMMDEMKSGVSAGGGGNSDYICPGGSGMLSIHYHTELDATFWRGTIPLELLYPGSWVPGVGEVGNSLINTWGGGFPRMGELVQSHPRKASAVYAHRVGSIITRGAQPHIYKKLSPKGTGGFRYFATMADPKWQAVHPLPEPGCITFGSNDSLGAGSWGDYKASSNHGYVWNLWLRYECCKKAAEIFLFAVP